MTEELEKEWADACQELTDALDTAGAQDAFMEEVNDVNNDLKTRNVLTVDGWHDDIDAKIAHSPGFEEWQDENLETN